MSALPAEPLLCLSEVVQTGSLLFLSVRERVSDLWCTTCTDGKTFTETMQWIFARSDGKNLGYRILDGLIFPFMVAPGFVLEDFALMEASYAIVCILRRFPKLELPLGYPVVPVGQEKQELTVFLKSAEGCKVVLE
ncbi:MAG: hypothetical protein Q9190_007265 [Brigantiaea leucoxantha]